MTEIIVKNCGNKKNDLINSEHEVKTIAGSLENTLEEALAKNNIYISSPCGGNGSCGKCRIKVIKGNLKITEADKRFLTQKELDEGIRLACQAVPEENIEIEILGNEENMSVLGGSIDKNDDTEVLLSKDISKNGKLGIAIDIGTTTLAASLIETGSGKTLANASGINHQRSFGADVISRIQASNEGGKDKLRESIQTDLKELINNLISKTETGIENIEKIVIAGNTTMGHLLMGYPCNSLGVYPFTPYNIEKIEGTAEEIIGIEGLKTKTVILPGISTYVGGDITSGLLSLNTDLRDKPIALIDLGTNGEMALGNKDRILVTSTAAGPAFEGGNISCGMGSVPGAVCGVTLNKDEVSLKTIEDMPPVGLCGTGVVELTRELYVNELIDETGLLDEDYEDDGYPFATMQDGKELFFTQKDVREIQLAKAAVRAGFETLLLRYGLTCDDLDAVYVAGGFGYFLDTQKAVDIGLFPQEALPKLKAVGNSSLKGAGDFMSMQNGDDRMKSIIDVSSEIPLSTDKDFNEIYVESMMFGEE